MNKSRNPLVIASMKTNLIGVAVAAVALTSFSAFADHDDDRGVAVSVGWNQPAAQPPCDDDVHAVSPVFHQSAPAPTPEGRYELRNTQQWIPDRYEQVTVQQCTEGRRGHGRWNHHFVAQRCYPVTQSRLIPGYYQPVQEWVFVPYPHHQHQGQARVGIRFGIR